MSLRLIALTAVLLAAGSANAASLSYTATNLGGSNWRYDYDVRNDSLAGTIAEFTIYFAIGQYANLAVAGAPAGWDPLVVQPDAGIPDRGFYDALALTSGIAPGGHLAGFAVTFDYLGTGAPGAQPFDIVDPVTFEVLSSGTTTAVPVPGAAWLISAAVLAGARRARRRV